MPKPRFQVGMAKQISFIPEAQEYHRYTEDAPKRKCGCGKGLYWAGELLTGYKLTCRNKRPLDETLFLSIERN
ncbi:MAG: hypothetical protein EHM33_00800 [Chloroflexi bacterium]|nr:MAG: hypothetical protein EHM33_00800 [Chloroflexota bacterium]